MDWFTWGAVAKICVIIMVTTLCILFVKEMKV